MVDEKQDTSLLCGLIVKCVSGYTVHKHISYLCIYKCVLICSGKFGSNFDTLIVVMTYGEIQFRS